MKMKSKNRAKRAAANRNKDAVSDTHDLLMGHRPDVEDPPSPPPEPEKKDPPNNEQQQQQQQQTKKEETVENKVVKKVVKKVPGDKPPQPDRPWMLNAYGFFAKEREAEILLDNPDIEPNDLWGITRREWKELPQERRDIYLDMYHQERKEKAIFDAKDEAVVEEKKAQENVRKSIARAIKAKEKVAAATAARAKSKATLGEKS